MSYSQEIYDAVRSKISNGDVGCAVAEVARSSFDVSSAVEDVKQDFLWAAAELRRPSVLYRPDITQGGGGWVALLGRDMAVGVVGTGETPAEAMADFDVAFLEGR